SSSYLIALEGEGRAKSSGERRKECRANKNKKAQDDEEHPSHSTYSFVITIYPHSFPFGGETMKQGVELMET
ncbi:AAEL005873-PA, partial [Aedes aegypti]